MPKARGISAYNGLNRPLVGKCSYICSHWQTCLVLSSILP